jgi:hypothetical protein
MVVLLLGVLLFSLAGPISRLLSHGPILAHVWWRAHEPERGLGGESEPGEFD